MPGSDIPSTAGKKNKKKNTGNCKALWVLRKKPVNQVKS